jgi:MarR family 2-MHQ and catechol resistance regulon transcriptional repressor
MEMQMKPSKHQLDSLKLYIKMIRASDAVSEKMHRHLSDDNLTPSQFGVLEALLHLGPMCQKDIGQKILKTSGNITLVIDNLEKRELVVRVKDPEDRRKFTIELTKEGRELIEIVFPRHAEISNKVFQVLDDNEKETLGLLLKKLGLA